MTSRAQLLSIVPSIQLKTILLPTDFSEASEMAATLASRIARNFGSKLFVVHATSHDQYWGETDFPPVFNEELVRKCMADFVEKNALDTLPHEALVVEGSAIEVIKQYSDDHHADLIVLGTNGYTGTAKFVLGSCSEGVFRTAKCPVLSVGPHVDAKNCTGTFKSIVFATDFEIETIDAFPYALNVAKTFNSRITLLHVVDPGHHGEELYQNIEVARLRLMKLLVDHEVALTHEPEIIVTSGDTSDEIVKISIGRGADLIVMGIHPDANRHGVSHALKGHAYPVTAAAHCPVLTVGTR